MDKPIHLHISYASSDRHGHFSYGHSFMTISGKRTLDEIQHDLRISLQQHADFDVPTPTILSIYEVSEELNNMLFPDPPKPRRFLSDMFANINGIAVADGHLWLKLDQAEPEGIVGPVYPLTEQRKGEVDINKEYIGKKVRVTVELIDE